MARRMTREEERTVVIVTAICLILYLFGIAMIKFLEWIQQNLFLAISLGIVFIVVFVSGLIFYLRYRKKYKSKLINQIIDSINEFRPFKNYSFELPYHIDLARFLKDKFAKTKIEERKGTSRPDIVIENIAIEVKGPTRSEDLTTIAHKCMTYGKKFFGGLIVVLFDVNVKHQNYLEWQRILKEHFPDVKIIKK